MDIRIEAIIAYGSNVDHSDGKPIEGFRRVVNRIVSDCISLVGVSSLWKSSSWPDPDQPDYINAILRVQTEMEPRQLLDRLHQIEAEFGRTRVRGELRYAARTLDLDLIAFGDRIIFTEGGLEIPHPLAAARGFVMGPLAEVQPDWVHPILKRTARELADQVTVGRDARIYASVSFAEPEARSERL